MIIKWCAEIPQGDKAISFNVYLTLNEVALLNVYLTNTNVDILGFQNRL